MKSEELQRDNVQALAGQGPKRRRHRLSTVGKFGFRRRLCVGWVLVIAQISWASPVIADQVSPAKGPATIVVTAQRPDQEVRKEVETALHSDPYFYDEHVTVTVIDGVVYLEGIVFDYSDVRAAKRISKKIAG